MWCETAACRGVEAEASRCAERRAWPKLVLGSDFSSRLESRQRERERAAGGMGPDAAHNGESQEAFLTEEDIQNFERLPTTPTQQECRLLWAGLLELQDEEAMREDTDTALSNGTAALPSRLTLASRHLCRIRKLIQGRSMTGLTRLAVALPCVLQGIQETVAEEIEQEIQRRQASRGQKRQREDAATDPHPHQEGEGAEEEEIRVEEDEEVELEPDEAAMMQTGRRAGVGTPTAKEGAWRALTRQEKRRLAYVVRTLLETQPYEAGRTRQILEWWKMCSGWPRRGRIKRPSSVR